MLAKPAWRIAALAIVLLPGCYRSHPADGSEDVPSRDVGPVRRDVAVDRDAPRDVPPDLPLTEEPCARDADCEDGLCVLDVRVPAADLSAAPLVCGRAGAARPATECDENADCENGLCAFAGGCVEPCVGDADCPSSDRCAEVWVVTGRAAMQSVSACVHWVDAPASTSVVENGEVVVMPFASNELAVGSAFRPRRVALHVAPGSSMTRAIERVTLDGTVLFDAEAGVLTHPAVAFFDLASVLVPNAPLPASVSPIGTLRVTVSTDGETSLHRVVLEHDGSGTTLDLNVYWLGISPTAARRRVVDGMIDGYGALLATFGARLGRVRVREAVGATLDLMAVADDEYEASETFVYGAGAARPALDVFLIASGSTLLGMAGGIPGAQTLHGTRSSGVVFGLDDLMTGLDSGLLDEGFPPVLLAHEVGHFLGLFHTSETDGSSYEPLSDTPVCDLSHDTSGDGIVDAFECMGLGAENVMFWGVTIADATFSAMQRDVLRGAAVLSP